MFLTDREKEKLVQVERLLNDKIAPLAAKMEENDDFPPEIDHLFAEHGVFAIPFPVKYNGLGFSMAFLCTVLERAGSISGALGVLLGNQTLGSSPIELFGSEEMKAKYLPLIAAGKISPAFALTEPGAGSDIRSIATTARKEDGYYIINGNKCFITKGSHADIYCVFAQVMVEDKKKLTTFLVERDFEGVNIGKNEKKMGLKGSLTTELFFENVKVPEANIIGEIGQGFEIAGAGLNKGRLSSSSQAIGIAQASINTAARHLKKIKEAKKRDISWRLMKLAEMETEVNAARALVQLSAQKYDRKDPDIVKFASMGKLFATEMVMRVTSAAMDLMEDCSYTKDCPVERMFRDSKIFAIFEGTSQIQEILISREILSSVD
ncbi:MAG: acyl-CoA dehydrogenase family protein [Bacillota bacterium]|nr:acyl-CoA dehydrogenase family protein [Bacillota bacterium]